MTCAQCTPTKLCHWCSRKAAKKEKAKQGIKKESEKRAKENRQYNKANKIFAAQNATCAAYLLDKETGIKCNGYADTTQHLRGRIGELLTNQEFQTRLCLAHHMWVGDNSKRAKELGLELYRIAINHPIEAKEIGLSGSRLNIEQ